MILWMVGTWKDWAAFVMKHRPKTLFPQHFSQIHPRDFAAEVKRLEEDREGDEVCIWINNPCILDHVPAENVVAIHGGKSKHLNEHPDWERWKDEFTAGEFWSMVGEDWVSEA